MALIEQFNKVSRNSNIHGTVEADYNIINKNGRKYLQINTYGSNERKVIGKVSQSIQFDEKAMRKLLNIIKIEINL
jgi:hypothetical protein